MKNLALLLALSTLIASTLLTGCGRNKKLLASKNQGQQLKKDSLETKTHRKLNEKSASAKNKNGAAKKVAVAQSPAVVDTTHTKATTDAEDVTNFVPLPPTAVANIFNSNYPEARAAEWIKVIPLVKRTDKNTSDYKVVFKLNGLSNCITYNANGQVIETRTQILPEQLPQNIYNAIRNKYPKSNILSATTFKHTKINGSYTAIIKSQRPDEEKEIIIMENGKFVE